MTASFENIKSFSYTEDWNEEFHKLADVELVAEGCILVAHSQVLCQSSVFAGAIRDTTNEGDRIRIEAPFEGVEKDDLDLFLAHLYGAPWTAYHKELSHLQRIVNLAIKCGFDGVAKRVLNAVTNPWGKENRFSRYLRSEARVLDNLECLASYVQEWVKICNTTSHPGLLAALSTFLAENHRIISKLDLQSAAGQDCELLTRTLDCICSKLKGWEDGTLDLYITCSQCGGEQHYGEHTTVSIADFKCPTGCFSKRQNYSGSWTVKRRRLKDFWVVE